MAENKKARVPMLRAKKGATDQEILAMVKKQFTAADLQLYTEIDEGIPAEKVLAEMDVLNRRSKSANLKSRRMKKK